MEKRYFRVSVYMKEDHLRSLSTQDTNMKNRTFFLENPKGEVYHSSLDTYYKNPIILDEYKLEGKVFFRPAHIPSGYKTRFGGNFVWSNTKAFMELYPHPIPVHDQIILDY